MVKIEYSGLDHTATGFIGEVFIEGFLIPGEDFSIPTNTNWNGRVEPVQYQVYDTYTLEYTVRDSDYQRFQKIQYAAKIIAIQGEKTYNMKLVDFSPEKLVNEFWKITFTLRDIDSKKIENIIKKVTNTNTEQIIIWNQDTELTLFSTDLVLETMQGVEHEMVLADDFNDKIIDFHKMREYHDLRFFLISSELADFYNQIVKIGSFSNEKLLYRNYSYSEFNINHDDIGEGLYQVNIRLFFNNRVELPQTVIDLLEIITYTPDDYITYD